MHQNNCTVNWELSKKGVFFCFSKGCNHGCWVNKVWDRYQASHTYGCSRTQRFYPQHDYWSSSGLLFKPTIVISCFFTSLNGLNEGKWIIKAAMKMCQPNSLAHFPVDWLMHTFQLTLPNLFIVLQYSTYDCFIVYIQPTILLWNELVLAHVCGLPNSLFSYLLFDLRPSLRKA